jgi:hypothetical protein
MIVRRGAIEKRPEPAKEFQVLATESSDIHEGFRTHQHREQGQQQHLIERIHHLAALAMVRQIIEIIEKYELLNDCRPYGLRDGIE